MSNRTIFAPILPDTQAPSTEVDEAFFVSQESFPPPLIGGEETTILPMKSGVKSRLQVSVDWLTISMVSDPEKKFLDEIEFVTESILGWPNRTLLPSPTGLTGCQRTFDLCGIDPETGEAVSLFKLGYMDETGRSAPYIVVSIPGHCCGYFDMAKMGKTAPSGAKITRVDVALDDFEGEFTVTRAKRIYNAGGFQSKGKSHGSMPSFSEVKSGRGAASHGRTFYVGNRKNGKMLRVYEKGLQMEDADRPKWVRWEVQFGNKDRVIPWGMLCDPADYFVGAYEPFEKLFAARLDSATPAFVKTEYERKSATSLQSILAHGRTQYGKAIQVARLKAESLGLTAGDVLDIVCRDGTPRGLIMPTPESLAHLFADGSKSGTRTGASRKMSFGMLV